MMKRKSRMHAPLVRRVLPSFLAMVLGVGCSEPHAFAAVPAAAPPAPFATPPVLAGTPDVATLVARVTPAVVNITTIHEVRADDSPFGFGFDPFGLGSDGRPGRGDQVYRQKALGSGFLVDAGGHVVTNAHVVEGADSVKVRLADDREFEAKVRGRDTTLDIAVLELVGARDLPQVSLGSSEQLRVGEYVVAIGNPFGLGNTVTMGIVSAKSRAIGAGPYDDFIQTDASINPGNSGGPLFNLRGQVVGINTAINPNGKGIGFAIPVDSLKDVLTQLVAAGKVARGRMGVAIQAVDPPLAKAVGLDRPKGALIGEVEPGGPADKAGLRAGDVILRVDDAEVGRAEELPRLVARHAPGSKVRVEYLRERAVRKSEVSLEQLGDPQEARAPGAPRGGGSSGAGPASALGLGLVDVPGQGVAVQQVAPGGRADGQLERGDFLLEINHTPIGQAADVARIVSSAPAGQALLFKVRRANRVRFVAIEAR